MDKIDENDANYDSDESDKDHYELVMTKTKRFYIIDLKKIKETIDKQNE